MPFNDLRIGIGFDVHPFVEGRKCILGGQVIDHSLGLSGHSDADVLLHAIIDSLLGAASMGDIGTLFPDSDNRYKGISSLELLGRVSRKMAEKKCRIINIDSVVICQEPKIAPYIPRMKKNIADAIGNFDPARIGIKGTTTEKLGFTGRKEGIAAEAVSLIIIPPAK